VRVNFHRNFTYDIALSAIRGPLWVPSWIFKARGMRNLHLLLGNCLVSQGLTCNTVFPTAAG
jgi:hypothetical protein